MTHPVRSRLLTTAVMALAVGGCTDSLPVEPIASPNANLAFHVPLPSRYLVGFEGAAEIAPEVLAAAGGQIVDSIPEFNVLVVEGVTDPDALYAANPKYVEAGFDVTIDPIAAEDPLDELAEVPGAESTPWFASGVQWNMRAMEAEQGWEMTPGGVDATICVVDTGVDDQHQELWGKVLQRANFVTAEPRVDDPNGHGSHVAGSAAAKGVVVNGVAPRANIISARVLNEAGSGSETAITNGIRWCADNGAHVANVSIGGIRYRGQASFITSPITYGNAINYANERGTVVVISAGNSNLLLPNPDQLVVPAQVPGTLIVGATGPLTRSTAPAPPAWNAFDPAHVWHGPDTKAFYSNFGPDVHVFAPGGRGNIPLHSIHRYANGVLQGSAHDQIWSVCSGQSGRAGAINSGGVPANVAVCTGTNNRYASLAGTSMAAPHVSGLVALLYSEINGTRTDANRARIVQCIRSTTDDIGDASIYGGGRVNVRKAIEAIRAGDC